MAKTRQLAHWIGRVGPPLALMGVIFYLSAQPNLRTELGTIDLIGRKFVHMAEFGLLWLLWLRALGWSTRAAWAAGAIAVLYAISDEFHQSFIDGRQGAPRDVAIDVTGILLTALLYYRVLLPRRRQLRAA
ncbi:VanZ family protein [Conexibacter stalactiti]|uniref:VanZ family protein n=1 Tax=Conexibacter stalactiti TaxID=1940611 RepID=A0ABU4HVL8_9ACTN|nr:VanZ family protein [Conexibacter stalactiti]MDW5597370.1 VanZ family protein [Conexibacter stalactiti]MEC5038012.1 VanZ family protein [Conexibacter stalactiti]